MAAQITELTQLMQVGKTNDNLLGTPFISYN